MYFSTDFLDHEDMNNNNIGLHGELSLGGINYGIDNINGMNGAMASHILSCLNCANEFSATNSVRLPRKLICGHTFCGQCMSTMLSPRLSATQTKKGNGKYASACMEAVAEGFP